MTKFASLKKIYTKIIIVKRNVELNGLGFLCYSSKACPDLPRPIALGSIFKLYITLPWLISPKREIDEKIKFRILLKMFTDKFGAIFGILAPHFQSK